jgi:hypothetical protein
MTMTDPTTSPEPHLGDRLLDSLTADQVRILLKMAGESGQLATLDGPLRAIDADLADTVRRVLQEATTAAGASPSSRKILEEWDMLWSEWANPIAEVGDEEGPFVNHDEPWHPPYFDHGALEQALEEAAGKLAGWIDRAYPLAGEPEMFLDSLEELNSNLVSYPEWFQPVEDHFTLPPTATDCVLKWTWLGLAGQPDPGRRLVDALLKLYTPALHTELKKEVCLQFFERLPEEVCREVYACLQEPRFDPMLASPHSLWHRLHFAYASRFDPAAHLETCRAQLPDDWRYGEPLIANAIARRDFAAAERYLEQTLSSLAGLPEKNPFQPERMLLPAPRYQPPEVEPAAQRFLAQWEEAAGRQGNTQRAACLRLQRVVLDSPEDWAAVLAAFHELSGSPDGPRLRETLFAEWLGRMREACAPHGCGKETAASSWVGPLIEARNDPAAGQRAFQEHLEAWLECGRKHAAFFLKNWQSLALLTRHLPQHKELPAQCPRFHACVLEPAIHISTILEQSLGQALELVCGQNRPVEVLPVWRRHLHLLVPPPGESGSQYRESAHWMKALSEVNRSSYDNLLSAWKLAHRRRRNLWQDMKQAGCPGL